MTAKVSVLIRFLLSQLGYVEQGGPDGHSGNVTKYGKAYGWNGVAWCSIFVWYAFTQVGLDLRSLIVRGYASANGAMRGFQAKGWFTAGVRGIRPGDVVFFHWTGEAAGADHTGICVRVDRNGIWTVEGNTSSGTAGSQSNGGGVYERLRDASVILGYGRLPMLKYDLVAAVKHVAVKALGKKYPTLHLGMTGKDVTRLQTLLNKAGVRVDGVPLKVDGHYGELTERAVRGLQTARHLHVDGVAGAVTLANLHF